MQQHRIVSREEWVEARKALLAKEKEMTRLRDRLNAERLALPWVKVEKDYVFDTPQGRRTLAELFGGCSQLIVNHFMLGPGWEAGCVGCSFEADHFGGALVHLENHDVSFVAISRAPLAEIERYKARMGWTFDWVSSHGSDFNYDYHVSFTPEELASGRIYYNYRDDPMQYPMEDLHGISAFYKNEAGEIFHTYSSYARGVEEFVGTLMILDRAPKGRNESGTMSFVKRHDEYGAPAQAHACCAS